MAERPHPGFAIDIDEDAQVMQVLVIAEVVDMQTLGTGHGEPPAHPELEKAVGPENGAGEVAQTCADSHDLPTKGEIEQDVGAECLVEQSTHLGSVQPWCTQDPVRELLEAPAARKRDFVQQVEIDPERRIFQNDDLAPLVIPHQSRSEARGIVSLVSPVHAHEGDRLPAGSVRYPSL